MSRREIWKIAWVAGLIASFGVAYVLYGAFSISAGAAVHYADGECSGQVLKLSRRGIIWKTWEGTLGVTQEGVYHQSFHFSVDESSPDRDALVRQLARAGETGELLLVEYDQRLGNRPWRAGTSRLIVKVSPARSRR